MAWAIFGNIIQVSYIHFDLISNFNLFPFFSLSLSFFPQLVPSLQEMCCRTIVSNNTVCSIEHLPIPNSLKYCLKSYLSSFYHSNKRYIHSYKCSHSRNANCINHASFKKKAKSLFSSVFRLNS